MDDYKLLNDVLVQKLLQREDLEFRKQVKEAAKQKHLNDIAILNQNRRGK